MKPNELRKLASATACWLAYREALGPRSSLYERLMLVPITDFMAQISWLPENEVSYRMVFDDMTLPDSYADFVATKRSGSRKFLLETKLLKGRAEMRRKEIESDIYRLA